MPSPCSTPSEANGPRSSSGPEAVRSASSSRRGTPDRVSALVLGDTYARTGRGRRLPRRRAAGDHRAVPARTIPIPTRSGPSTAPTTSCCSLRAWPTTSGSGSGCNATSRRGASPASARVVPDHDERVPTSATCLPQIQVPTLVLHRRDNQFTPPAPRPLPRRAHPRRHVGDGARTRPDHVVRRCRTRCSTRSRSSSPAIATVPRTACSRRCCSRTSWTRPNARPGMGDSAWRGELDAHDAIVRAELDRFGGREVNTTGDGFVAAFDSPTAAVRGALAIVRCRGRRPGSRCARVSTPASANGGATTSPDSRCTSRRVSPRMPARERGARLPDGERRGRGLRPGHGIARRARLEGPRPAVGAVRRSALSSAPPPVHSLSGQAQTPGPGVARHSP